MDDWVSFQSANTTGDVLLTHTFYPSNGTRRRTNGALEASSHGLDQYRLQGVPIIRCYLYHFIRDHLDYRADMASYRDAKAKLLINHCSQH